MKGIKDCIEIRMGGKHKYVRVNDIQSIFDEVLFRIRGHIRAEFYDKYDDLCVSFDKKKLFRIINYLNPSQNLGGRKR